MRILFLTSELPFPPTNGVRIKSYNLLKGLLEKGHEIHLVSFYAAEVDRDLDAGEDLIKRCKSMNIVQLPHDRSQLAGNVIRNFHKKEVILMRFKSKDFMKKLINTVEDETIDLAHFDLVSSTLYADLLAGSMPIVASINDSYSLWLKEKLLRKPFPKLSSVIEKMYYALTFPLATSYERSVYEKFHKVHVVSEIDRSYLRRLNPNIDVDVIPNGVDTEYFKPVFASNEESLVFVAHLKGEHASEALWFIRKVFKAVKKDNPNLSLYLVGKDPDPMLLSEAARVRGVVVTGYVDDVRPYIDNATLIVDPATKSCGILNHVLHAMAMEKTVVGTPLSFLAINGTESWKNVVVAKNAEEFVSNIKSLLADENRRTTIGRNARRLIEEHYTWENIIVRYERMYREAIEKFQESSTRHNGLTIDAPIWK